MQPLDQWGTGMNSGVANLPTATKGRCQAASTRGYSGDSEDSVEGKRKENNLEGGQALSTQ